MTTTATSLPAWLIELQKEAAERAKHRDWPTKMDEEWRRTPMTRLSTEGFRQLDTCPEWVEGEADASYAAVLLVHGSDRVSFWSASDKVKLRVPEVGDERLMDHLATANDDRFLDEHLGSGDCLFVLEIAPGALLDKPVLLHWNANSQKDEGTLRHPRFLFKVGKAAEAKAVLRWDSAQPVFLNSGTSVFLAEGTVFSLTEIQTLSEESLLVDHSYSFQERNSVFRYQNISIGTLTAKTKWEAAILGEGAELQAKGLYVCRGKQHKDLRLVQIHRAPRCRSNTLFKGAVRDRSRSVFQGLIQVDPNGKGTDAYLSNKNLILNTGARADSLPQLKIDHNDLRCTHGSTTGMVDEEEIHYLQTRGLDRAEAKVFITLGLFQEIIDTLPDAFRIPVESLVEGILRDG